MKAAVAIAVMHAQEPRGRTALHTVHCKHWYAQSLTVLQQIVIIDLSVSLSHLLAPKFESHKSADN
jgi:hypothetical protein